MTAFRPTAGVFGGRAIPIVGPGPTNPAVGSSTSSRIWSELMWLDWGPVNPTRRNAICSRWPIRWRCRFFTVRVAGRWRSTHTTRSIRPITPTSRPWPPSYDQAANWHWADFSKATGVSYYRSTVKMADIHDGTSLTYMIGEKRVAGFGDDPGDDQGLLMGYDQDTSRWTALSLPPTPDGATPKPQRFGSAHPAVCQFIMCDGSLREIAYAIDPEIHRRLGNRLDGRVIEDTAISP